MPIVSGEKFFSNKPGKVVESAETSLPVIEEEEPGYLQRVGQSLKDVAVETGRGIQESAAQMEGGAESILKGDVLGGLKETAIGVGRAGLRSAGGFSKAALTPLAEAPGIKQVGEFIGEKLSETTPIKKYGEWSQRYPEAAKDIENVLDIGAFLGTGKAVNGGLKSAKAGLEDITGGITQKAGALTKNTPENIMNRVARLNPTDEVKFTKVAGVSPGKYLANTGNFGNPQDILTRESAKFIQSKNLVDSTLSKLPGSYKLKPINTALEGLIKKGTKVSSPGAEADYLKIAKELLKKSKSQGLSMSEINEVKRIFERQIRLGYNKTLNPDLIDKATRIDSAIREWQFSKASELGFKNIAQMNKQTQISKFLVDKLGNKVVGQQALNNITLTDWIMLSGGNPAAIGGFLTKKFFSSKAVQARIAQLLSGKEFGGTIKPELVK